LTDNTIDIPSAAIATIASTTPAVLPAVRNPMIDACRMVAAIAILWMHSWEAGHIGQPGEIGRFAVPFFTVAAIYLLTASMLRNRNRPFGPYLASRFNRLYIPFLAWSVLGLAAMWIKHRFIAHTAMESINPAMLLLGTSFQLWYLPFLFLTCIALFLLSKATTSLRPAPRALTAIVALAIGCAFSLMPRIIPLIGNGPAGLRMFLAFSWDAVPSALCGYGLAILLHGRKIGEAPAFLGLVITIACMAIVTLHGRINFLETVSGVTFMIFALLDRHGPLAAGLAKYPFLIYGTYLCQGVVLEAVQTLAYRAHFKSSPPLQATVFTITAVLCIALCFALNRSKATRWMLG